MAISKAAVRKELKRFGLSAYEDLVLDALEPAVRLVTSKPVKKSLPVGSSKFGGEPDLASPEDWPIHPSGRPMHFLGQIALSDLPAAHLRGTRLPRSGWLRFWWDSLGRWLWDNTRLGDNFQGEDFRVTFDDCRRTQLKRCPFHEFPEPNIPKAKKLRFYTPPKFQPDREVAIQFKPVTSIQYDAVNCLFEKVDQDDPGEAWERVYKFYESMHSERRRQPVHRVLGGYHEGQTNMRGDCHELRRDRGKLQSNMPHGPRKYTPPTDRQMKPWRLLAILDTDDNLDWCWGDAGEICFWIREQDLAKHDFAAAIGMIESS